MSSMLCCYHLDAHLRKRSGSHWAWTIGCRQAIKLSCATHATLGRCVCGQVICPSSFLLYLGFLQRFEQRPEWVLSSSRSIQNGRVQTLQGIWTLLYNLLIFLLVIRCGSFGVWNHQSFRCQQESHVCVVQLGRQRHVYVSFVHYACSLGNKISCASDALNRTRGRILDRCWSFS